MANPEKLTTEEKKKLKTLRGRIKITKVVCTRSVKGRAGDSYVGFSAAWDTTQEDGGQGLVHTGESEECPEVMGMTLREGELTSLLLGLQVDLAAHSHARAGGNMTPEQYATSIRAIKGNYSKLLAETLRKNNGED